MTELDLARGLSIAGVALVLFYLPYTFYLIARLPRRGGLVEAFARVLLVPGKRRTWFLLLSAEGAFFVLSGLCLLLAEVGVVGSYAVDVLAPLFFVVAVLALILVQWIGLRVAPLTHAEREAARGEIPQVIDSLALAPFAFRPEAGSTEDPRAPAREP